MKKKETTLLHYFVCFRIHNKRLQLKYVIIWLRNYLFLKNYDTSGRAVSHYVFHFIAHYQVSFLLTIILSNYSYCPVPSSLEEWKGCHPTLTRKLWILLFGILTDFQSWFYLFTAPWRRNSKRTKLSWRGQPPLWYSAVVMATYPSTTQQVFVLDNVHEKPCSVNEFGISEVCRVVGTHNPQTSPFPIKFTILSFCTVSSRIDWTTALKPPWWSNMIDNIIVLLNV